MRSAAVIVCAILIAIPKLCRAQTGMVSVTSYGAVGDGTTDDTAAFVSALGSGADYLIVPHGASGQYKISSTLTIPSNIIIQFTGNAELIAGVNNLIFFSVPTAAYFSEIRDATLYGNGHSGVEGFALNNFRERARIDNVNMSDMYKGIVLQQLCWDLVIDNPHSNNVTYPIIVQNGSNSVDIRHPALNSYTTGIQIMGGQNSTVGVKITGGYIQSGTTGILDQAIATRIEDTYFESNTAADIDLSGATNPEIRGTEHFGQSSNAYAIEATNTSGARIDNPLMGSGNRLGLYDFGSSNTDCYEWHANTSSYMNLPVGVTSGLGTFVTNP